MINQFHKLLFFVLCGWAIWTDVAAQVQVWGVIREKSKNQPISGVVVALVKPVTGEILSIGRSDLDGGYLLEEIPQGKYWIRIGTVGYRRFERSLQIGQERLRFDIRLEQGLLEKERTNTGSRLGRIWQVLRRSFPPLK